jgi:glucose/arabinose dehydrogenase/mono/diheme cytochrome c family protein
MLNQYILKSALITGLLFSCSMLIADENKEESAKDPEEAAKGLGLGAGSYFTNAFSVVFNEQCGDCHGENLLGTGQGTPLLGIELTYGESISELNDSIADGMPDNGMPGYSEVLSADEINNLSIYISEKRSGFDYLDYKVATPYTVPEGIIKTELHNFRLETVISDLDPLPYSLELLPDGRMLVVEKLRGLRIISKEGKKSELIKNTPKVYGETFEGPFALQHGVGWLLGVAIHPEYEENGWIYLSYGDRCEDCNESSRKAKRPVSMVALVRGRIKDGEWIDQEVIFQPDVNSYGLFTDLTAGGRICFDRKGYVFLSIGMKGDNQGDGIQNLGLPQGKILRLHDDGRIPEDNPFVNVEGALKAIWTYGHRTPQGLEYKYDTDQLWEAEMGPRGGDEINLIQPGRNYGWPLTSKGVNYDGTPVDWGTKLGIEFDLKDIEQPIVDMTPAPAVSSMVIYTGKAFPKWHNNFLVQSLKAASLYRYEFKDNKHIHTETVIDNLTRMRDIEVGPSGEIYLLLEHVSGGRIVRMVPSDT